MIPRSLPIVLQALPLSFSVFLLSRDTLSEWTDRAGSSDTDTAMITEMDLAFSPEEIRSCFAARHVSLNDAEAADIGFFEGCAMLATLDPRHPPTGKSGKLLAEVTPDETRGLAIQSASLSQNLPFMHRSNRDYSACAADIEGSMAAFGATFAPFLRKDYKAVAAMLRAGLAYEQNH